METNDIESGTYDSRICPICGVGGLWMMVFRAYNVQLKKQHSLRRGMTQTLTKPSLGDIDVTEAKTKRGLEPNLLGV